MQDAKKQKMLLGIVSLMLGSASLALSARLHLGGLRAWICTIVTVVLMAFAVTAFVMAGLGR